MSPVKAGFRPALPPIPRNLFYQIIAFFRSFLREGREMEALVHVYWDKALEEYRVAVPTQWVGKATVDAVPTEEEALDEERDRRVNKIEALEQKKQEYETILRQDLDQLDDEFMTLGMSPRSFPAGLNSVRWKRLLEGRAGKRHPKKQRKRGLPCGGPRFLYNENHSLGEWLKKACGDEDDRKTPFVIKYEVRSANCPKNNKRRTFK